MKRWPPPEMHQAAAGWRGHRRWLFWRFALGFVLMFSMLAALMGALAWFFTSAFGGEREITFLVLAGGCGISLALPILALGVSWILLNRYATPVAQVMAVTEAVADGDLSARVEAVSAGRLGQLARAVNHMVSELEQTYEQRRRLTADIAHELRTPLQIIQGNLEGILDEVYEPTTAHILNTLEETQLLSRLVEDLATLSQAESGRLPLVFEPVDFSELLSDVQTSFSGQAEKAGIDLRLEMGSTALPVIEGDIQRLAQILGNLVANAIRHTPAGGRITLRCQRHDEGVQIQVIDTGEGIPAEDLPFIFDRFWRGDRARTHTSGVGGGLGLAIAKQLVAAHEGTITATSELGTGTTFAIILPARRPAHRDDPEHSKK